MRRRTIILFLILVGICGMGLLLLRSPRTGSMLEEARTNAVGNALIAAAAVMTNLATPLAPSSAPTASEQVQVSIPLSPGAKAVIESTDKARPPSPAELETVGTNDVPALLAEFRALPLTNRTRVIWTLAYIGGPAVGAEFIRALEEDYGGREFNQAELYAMVRLVEGLGLASFADESAFQYVASHITPASWIAIRKWKDPGGRDPDEMLAGSAVIGIGLSGRSEAESTLRSILDGNPQSFDWVGGYMDAQFYLSARRNHDRKEVLAFCATEDGFREYSKWRSTEEAKRLAEELQSRLQK
jgi:hypothetical protein